MSEKKRVKMRDVARGAALLAIVPIISCLMGGEKEVYNGSDGWIAFVSDRDGNDEIYRVNPDGSGLRRLTDNGARDGSPAWSPDARKIAFRSDRDGNNEIYIMNADGTEVKRLTDNKASDFSPSWSPDGKRMAFISDREGDCQIYIMDVDGKNVKRITQGVDVGGYLSFSPDGKKFLFVSQRGKICIINEDGSNMVIVTKGRHLECASVWSPEGCKIAFHAWCREEQCEGRSSHNVIYLVNEIGGEIKILTHAKDTYTYTDDRFPTWSPDGKRIAFSSIREGRSASNPSENYDIYVIDADGSNIRRVVKHKAQDTMPCWSPIPK